MADRTASPTPRTIEYRGITKRAKQLLDRHESIDVEFKRTPSAVEGTDLVAFANSDDGGTFLVGIDEINSADGVQRGKIVGCQVDDSARLIIVNKAEECVPPVEVEIYIENLSAVAFLRVEIPPAKNANRPYCTKKGIYTIRGDARTKALLPGRLLALFAEVESNEFLMRFRGATRELETTLITVKDRMERELESLQRDMSDMAFVIEQRLDSIFNSASEADDLASEAAGSANDTLYEIQELKGDVASLEWQIDDIYESVEILMKHNNLVSPGARRAAVVEAMMLAREADKPKPKKRRLKKIINSTNE